MKKIPRLLLTFVVLLAVSGCLQIDTLITVRADGTGTVREKVRLSEETVEMIRQMEEMAQQTGDAQSSDGGIIDREELQRRATAMGPGVRFVSVEEIPGSGGFGYEAVWAFDDVNTLRVEQNAEGALPQPGGEPSAAEEGDNPAAAFRLEPGTPAVLHITSTLAGGEAPPEGPTPSADEAQVPPEMLREMFAGMRFSIAVEVEGAIVKTNASHQAGSRVTLFELDFDRLLQDPKAIALMSATDAPDPMQLKDALRGLPGLKVETATDLQVAFVAPGTDMATLAAMPGDAVSAAADSTTAAMDSVMTSTADMATEAAASVAQDTTAAASVAMPAPSAAPAPTPELALAAAAPAMPESAPAMPETVAAAMPAPDNSGVSTTVESVQSAPAGSTAAASVSATPLGTIAGYSWRGIDVGDLAAQRYKLVALTDASGGVTKGMVMEIGAASVTVRRASMDGGGSVDLPISTLRSASVFEQGS